MKKIGILFGMENTFPPAVVEKINSMKVDGITAEFVKIGGIRMDEPKQYEVIIDRISQDIQFYRAYLKNAALHGTIVVNNPFWWTADDKFFNYALAHKMGVAIPPTVILQHGVEFEEYYRCYVVGQEKVHIMKYDPRAPHHERYVKGNPPPSSPELRDRIERDALSLCRALGYDMNTVEFAVEGGVPYAIDFLNPAPDAEITSVGQENFDWIVNAAAEMAVKMAQSGESPVKEFRWAEFLAGAPAEKPSRKGEPAWVAERKRGKGTK